MVPAVVVVALFLSWGTYGDDLGSWFASKARAGSSDWRVPRSMAKAWTNGWTTARPSCTCAYLWNKSPVLCSQTSLMRSLWFVTRHVCSWVADLPPHPTTWHIGALPALFSHIPYMTFSVFFTFLHKMEEGQIHLHLLGQVCESISFYSLHTIQSTLHTYNHPP